MTPPRIGLDATYAQDPEPTGVAVYSRRILHGLATRHPGARYRWLYRPHRYWSSRAESLPPEIRRGFLWEPAMFPRLDLFHGLNQRLPSRGARRMVVTFHDLFVMTAEYSTPEFRARFTDMARQAARRAHAIIAISAFTATQVRDLLHVEPARIHVVPHGVDPVSPSSAQSEPLILHVGAIQKRKNLARLVRAFAATPAGWRLMLAGGDGYGSQETHDAIAASPRRNDILTPGYLTPSQLEDAWRRARLFAFPSLDEGFGMPVLEAMARGVPVISSNSSALPEAAGGAAQLLDPTDENAWACTLRHACENEDLRLDLARRGLERARLATWDRSVDLTWDVYRTLL